MGDQLVCRTDEPRACDVIAALNDWNRDLSPEDRDGKYQKMAEDPFVFYRGSNHLFWRDFAHDDRLRRFGSDRSRTWIQGDLHVENFGAFGNDKGVVVYDINDFDEAVIADYQFDIWRMAVSMVLANKAQGEDALSDGEIADVVRAFAMAYLEAVARFCKDGGEHEVVFDKSSTGGQLDKFLKEAEGKNARKDMLREWTKKGRFRVPETQGPEDELRAVEEPLRSQLTEAVRRYAEKTLVEPPEGMHADYFAVRDVAWRLGAGTGSLGVPRFYVLIYGADEKKKTDSILDVKRQSKPTAYRFLDEWNQHEYEFFKDKEPGQDAIWHAAACRSMAKSTDNHLGWLELSDGYYSVRERSFFKTTLKIKKLENKDRFVSLGKQWGELAAAVHSRSLADFNDDYPKADLRVLFRRQSGEKSFKCQVAGRTQGKETDFCSLADDIAFSCARQVEEDHSFFVKALGPQ